VLPGRLSVSRTFGDIEAKLQKYGGKEGVIIAQPEISQFTVRPDFHDFIILGCDGVFDRLTNQNALDMSWDVVNQLRASEIKNNSTKLTIHEVTGQIADQLLT
jgi:serine/threonine protein phosphatase PrpC